MNDKTPLTFCRRQRPHASLKHQVLQAVIMVTLPELLSTGRLKAQYTMIENITLETVAYDPRLLRP